MSSPFGVPGAKATLALAVLMSVTGIWGVSRSLTQLTSAPGEYEATDPSASPEVAEAGRAFFEPFLESPVSRAVSVANLLASALLLVASFTLTGRARSALFWTTQALWTNAAYSLAAAGANIYLFRAHGAELARFFEAMLRAQPSPGPPPPPELAAGVPWLFIALSAIAGALLAALYLGMLRVARRETVQKFVRREA
ncbi:MAG: hypothetical protein M5U28_23630 [Sandaracinaceae bacterium]|nr:hypothetical protein [Sandaracinaceae bacterium]